MNFKSYNILITAANKLAKNYAKKFISTVLIPIDYTRTKEIPAILDVSGIDIKKNKKLRILDIGSPQIFCLKNLDVRYADITDLFTISNIGQFDYIFSCSVFEHIHPENGGDIIASKNVTQLLKPGGIFSFSVPYYKRAFNEYQNGDVYAIKSMDNEKTFFQRFYDEESLNRQIIEPTGLTVLEKKYIGERYYFKNNIHKRMAFLVGMGKRALLFGRFFKNISDFFMEESSDFKLLKKPYVAIFSLKKNS
jgi:SAM-dependent methyltransferase